MLRWHSEDKGKKLNDQLATTIIFIIGNMKMFFHLLPWHRLSVKQGFHPRCQHIFEWPTKPHETVMFVWVIHVLFCMSAHGKVRKRQIWCVAGKASWMTRSAVLNRLNQFVHPNFVRWKKQPPLHRSEFSWGAYFCLLNYEDNGCLFLFS
jgi:hypothetical protein